MLASAGEIDRAEEAANKQIKVGKSDCWGSLVIALQRGQAAKVDRLKKQLFASWAQLNRGARQTPRFEYYRRGYLALKSGQAEEAIEYFKQTLKHRPPYWNIDDFEDCLAAAYLELGRLDEAIAEYERVLSINPNYPLAHYHLAQAYGRRGDSERSRSEHQKFLEVWKDADRDLPEVRTATQQLAAGS
jgi:tetratricopeptide (TPR) repeat protein